MYNYLEIQRQQRMLDSIDTSLLVEKNHFMPKRDDIYLKRLSEIKEKTDLLFEEYKKSEKEFQEKIERSTRWVWFGIGVWVTATIIGIIIDLARIFN